MLKNIKISMSIYLDDAFTVNLLTTLFEFVYGLYHLCEKDFKTCEQKQAAA